MLLFVWCVLMAAARTVTPAAPRQHGVFEHHTTTPAAEHVQGHQGHRVAIIGAGIGGAALAHYVQAFGAEAGLPNCTITVFERSDYIGGRLKVRNTRTTL